MFETSAQPVSKQQKAEAEAYSSRPVTFNNKVPYSRFSIEQTEPKITITAPTNDSNTTSVNIRKNDNQEKINTQRSCTIIPDNSVNFITVTNTYNRNPILESQDDDIDDIIISLPTNDYHNVKPSSIYERYIDKKTSSDLKIKEILNTLGDTDNIKIITEMLCERNELGPSEAKQYINDFIIEAINPKTPLHGIMTALCLFSAFGRHCTFILDKNSTTADIIVTLIGSLSTGALSLDAISAAPASMEEYSSQLSKAQKTFNKIYFPALCIATASDMARVGIAAHREFGLAIAILGTASEGITILAIGCEAINLLYKAGELKKQKEQLRCTFDDSLTIGLIAISGFASTVSAYAFPLGVEQWTNHLPELFLPPSGAYSYAAQAAKIVIMLPHAFVNLTIETYMTVQCLLTIKNMLFELKHLATYRQKLKKGNAPPLTKAEERVEKKINYILNELQSCSSTRTGKIMLFRNLFGLFATLTVGSFALYNAFQYQIGLSDDTRERADDFRSMANTTRHNASIYPGGFPDTLEGLADWAENDAAVNEYALGTTMAVQLAAAFQFTKVAGMIIGVGRALFKSCCKFRPQQLMTPDQIHYQLVRLSETQLDQIIHKISEPGNKSFSEFDISVI